MKAIVVYKSKTGFTKNYAEWIAESLHGEAVPAEQAKKIDLSSYDALVFGGWTFAGSIQGLKEMKPRFESFRGKKAVFATGSSPADSPEVVTFLEKNLSEEEHKSIRAFYMPGGLDYTKLHGMNKLMMKMMGNMMKKQHGEDSQQYKDIAFSHDGTDRKYIQPLLDYIEN